MKMVLTPEQERFLKMGNYIKFGDEEWCNLPFWFSKNKDGSWEMVTDDIPEKVKKFITKPTTIGK